MVNTRTIYILNFVARKFNFHGHGGVVDTIVVGSARYASYCGLIFVNRGMPQNLYTLKISTHIVCTLKHKVTLNLGQLLITGLFINTWAKNKSLYLNVSQPAFSFLVCLSGHVGNNV